jgi:hypothetical protein
MGTGTASRTVTAIVGSLLGAFYAFYLFVIPIANCTQRSADPWLATFIIGTPLGLLTLGMFAAAQGASRKTHWLTLVLAPLLAGAAWNVLPFLWGSTILGYHVCHVQTGYHEPFPTPLWHRFWAPFHLALLLGIALLALRLWRRPWNVK